VFIAARQPSVVFRFAWVLLVTNLTLSLVLVPWWGAAGAAVAAVVAQYGASAVYVAAFRRTLGIPLARVVPWAEWCRSFAQSALCALPLLALPAAWSPVARLLCGGAIYGAMGLVLLRREPAAGLPRTGAPAALPGPSTS
jgi:Na+-driven multidrug efflux pump